MTALEVTVQAAITAAYAAGRTDAIKEFADLVIEDENARVPVSLQRIITHTLKVLDTKTPAPVLVIPSGP